MRLDIDIWESCGYVSFRPRPRWCLCNESTILWLPWQPHVVHNEGTLGRGTLEMSGRVSDVTTIVLMSVLTSLHLLSQDCSSAPLVQSGIPSHRSDPAMHLFSGHKNIPSGQFTTVTGRRRWGARGGEGRVWAYGGREQESGRSRDVYYVWHYNCIPL